MASAEGRYGGGIGRPVSTAWRASRTPAPYKGRSRFIAKHPEIERMIRSQFRAAVVHFQFGSRCAWCSAAKRPAIPSCCTREDAIASRGTSSAQHELLPLELFGDSVNDWIDGEALARATRNVRGWSSRAIDRKAKRGQIATSTTTNPAPATIDSGDQPMKTLDTFLWFAFFCLLWARIGALTSA